MPQGSSSECCVRHGTTRLRTSYVYLMPCQRKKGYLIDRHYANK